MSVVLAMSRSWVYDVLRWFNVYRRTFLTINAV